MGTTHRPATLRQLLEWLGSAPDGTSIPAASMHRLLSEMTDAEPDVPVPAAAPDPVASSWRTRLWTVPAETRLTLPEAVEALGRSRSWVYKRTGPKSPERLPCRRLEGELEFVAGELRQWIRDHEEVIEPGRPERTLHAVRGGAR
jgi:predicted DNA-binding transcriptional regulator AlpA